MKSNTVTSTELVIDVLYRGAIALEDRIGGTVRQDASIRLMALAKAIGPTELEKIIQERNSCISGFAKLMEDILCPKSTLQHRGETRTKNGSFNSFAKKDTKSTISNTRRQKKKDSRGRTSIPNGKNGPHSNSRII